MGRPVTYFLTVASPWVYLGHAVFRRLADRHGLSIDYRPLPVGRLFGETGGLPLRLRHPARQRYRLVELRRWREKRGVPLDLAPAHPLSDPTLADGVAIAALLEGLDPEPFIVRAQSGLWAEGLDLSDEATLGRLAAASGLPAAILHRARSADVAARYEANLQAAIEAGAFGAPTYVLDGEAFWGQDRLELLAEALESGRQPYRSDGTDAPAPRGPAEGRGEDA